MKNKYAPTFLGVYQCQNCECMSTHNVIPENKNIHSLFIITGIPFTSMKKYAVCSHCGFKSKLRGHWKDKYQQAVRNNFDNQIVVNEFINKIEETCIENEVVINGVINKQNLERTVDEIYMIYSPQQGYDREFYDALCEVYALHADNKFTKYKLMFRT